MGNGEVARLVPGARATRGAHDQVRAVYAGKAGLRPGNSGIPRLAEEDR